MPKLPARFRCASGPKAIGRSQARPYMVGAGQPRPGDDAGSPCPGWYRVAARSTNTGTITALIVFALPGVVRSGRSFNASVRAYGERPSRSPWKTCHFVMLGNYLSMEGYRGRTGEFT